MLTLEDMGEELQGIVTVVSSMEETLSWGPPGKGCDREVETPGRSTTGTGCGSCGEASSCEPGAFVPKNGDDPQRGLVRPGKPGGGEPSGFRSEPLWTTGPPSLRPQWTSRLQSIWKPLGRPWRLPGIM